MDIFSALSRFLVTFGQRVILTKYEVIFEEATSPCLNGDASRQTVESRFPIDTASEIPFVRELAVASA